MFNSIFSSTAFSIRLNNELIEEPMSALNLHLTEDDTLVFFPTLSDKGGWVGVWTEIMKMGTGDFSSFTGQNNGN